MRIYEIYNINISFCIFPIRAFINYQQIAEQNKLVISILSVANLRMYTLRFAFPVD